MDADVYYDEMGKDMRGEEIPADMQAKAEEYHHELLEHVAEQDEELLHTLVTALRDDLSRLEATLEAGRKLAADPAVPAARTAEALRRAAHALKNSAATLCFEELRLRAAALEQAARQVLAGTPENAAGLGSLAAACAGALARAEEALRRDNG